jgi:holo-[acyl-carrier protein] synthase
MIRGLGTHIVETVRIGHLIERAGERFLRHVFTDAEMIDCRLRREYLQHYAERWAAKQAVAQSLGTGFVSGLRWTDLEIRRQPDGIPMVRLSHGFKELAQRMGVTRIVLAMSHCRTYATASAIAWSDAFPAER